MAVRVSLNATTTGPKKSIPVKMIRELGYWMAIQFQYLDQSIMGAREKGLWDLVPVLDRSSLCLDELFQLDFPWAKINNTSIVAISVHDHGKTIKKRKSISNTDIPVGANAASTSWSRDYSQLGIG
jgi:hypothetical protein